MYIWVNFESIVYCCLAEWLAFSFHHTRYLYNCVCDEWISWILNLLLIQNGRQLHFDYIIQAIFLSFT